MRAVDVMTTPVIALTPAATVDEAIALMVGNGFTTLPVIGDDARLVGLVTETDLGLSRFASGEEAVWSPALGHAPTVAAIMSTPSPPVSADTELGELAAILVASRQRCLPVVADDHVVGMVSWRDLLRATLMSDGRAQGRHFSLRGLPGESDGRRRGSVIATTNMGEDLS